MRFILLASVFLLSACAPSLQEKLESNKPAFNSQIDTCNSKYLPFTKATAVPMVDCKRDAQRNYYIVSGWPYMDATEEQGLLVKQAAIAFSQGKISEDEFQNTAELINLKAQQEYGRRDQVAAQRRAAAWAQFQQQQSNQALINQMNRPVTTNCNSFANSVNCTSY